MRLLRTSTAAALLLASLASASAHGIWIAQRHGDQAIVYGHGASDEAYDPAKLTSLAAATGDGKAVAPDVSKAKDHVTFSLPDSAVYVSATMDNGYWTERQDGSWVNKAKDEVTDARTAGRNFKHAVSLVGEPGGAPRPQGLPLEIVPLADPLHLHAGDTLEIKVLADGVPVADVPVTAEYTTDSEASPVRTDAEGKARITVRNSGLNVIAASYKAPTDDPAKADTINHFTTFSFTLSRHSH